MNSLIVGYSGDPGRGPSADVFRGFSDVDPSQVTSVFEDFKSFNNTYALASNLGRYASDAGGYISYEDTGGTILGSVSADYQGAIVMTTDTTDNDENDLALGDNTGGAFTLKTGMRGFAYECRMRFTQILTQNFFCGLCEPGRAVADGLIADAGTLATKSILGWSVLEAAAGTMKGTHGLNGQAAVQETLAVKTLAVSTWYKFGVRYIPRGEDGYVCKWYVDGTFISGITTEGSSFPSSASGVVLTPFFAQKNATTTANVFTIDWYRAMAKY